MNKPTRIEDSEAHYKAGIGVVAVTLDVGLRALALGFDSVAQHGFPIAPLAALPGGSSQTGPNGVDSIEDYVTVCLAGSAGRYLRSVALRCHLKRSLGSAGLELTQLRQIWDGMEPESERALVIALGCLKHMDDGNPEATMYRLWRRAVLLLKQPRQRSQLSHLARRLLAVGRMTGAEVLQILST